MLTYLSKILDLIHDRKKFLLPMVLLFLTNTFLDLLSLGLLIPFVTVISDPSFLNESSYLSSFQLLAGVESYFDLVILFCLVLLILFLIKLTFSILVNYTILRFSFQTVAQLKIKLMTGFQGMPYSVFIKRNSSEYIQSILDFSGIFNGSVLMPLLRLFAEIFVTSGILLFLLFTQGSTLLIILAVVGIFVFIYDLVTRQRLKDYGKKGAFANEKAIQSVHEAMQGFKEIRILGKESGFFKRLSTGAEGNARYAILSQTLGFIPRYTLEFVIVSFVISYILIAILDDSNQLSSILPTLVIFAVASVRLLPSVSMIVNALTQIRLGEYATTRLHEDLIELQDVLTPITSTKSIKEFKSLELKNVFFKYSESSDWAIQDFSLKISKGESIGIVGPSGSGKTTIVDIILGLLEINSGKIIINERLIENSLEPLRGHCAYLPQEIFIVDDTLKANIALGEGVNDVNLEKISEAINRSSLNELVTNLEQGIDTKMGDKGVRLSGGQRQRVAIARAFYNEREILVLDESTSALDTKTESDISDQIDELKGKKTLIIIAHRESTLKRCDKVIRLDKGKLEVV